MNYIKNIKSPDDIKSLSEKELDLLACEIRDFLIEKVSKSGGHLASNLGIVELTIALHFVLNTPYDKIIWDVGHQSYVHKILTGRWHQFDGLRQFEGLSGFPKKAESPHDIFDAGHSSNSISVGLGIVKARDIKNEDFSVVSVIGDGALTGGIAFEALNNAGYKNSNFIIIINDNEMSISQNIGGISSYLTGLRTAPAYTQVKKQVKSILNKIPKAGNTIYSGLEKFRDAVKYTLVPGIVFEELGFTFLGPVDGHNIQELISVIQNARNLECPVIIHTITKKGKGYLNAEKQPHRFHGIAPFDPETGVVKQSSNHVTYSKVFGDQLVKIADGDERIVAITAAMTDGTGLKPFSHKHPHRFFDVGIAEQHAVSFAAGLAINGMKPVVSIYSTFLQRAYDEIMMDICLQNLPVVLCVDRSGVVGEDGETHHGIYDISYLSHMPNLTILSPKDGIELQAMMAYAVKLDQPCVIKYPRGKAGDMSYVSQDYAITGKAEILKEGSDICLIAVGRMVEQAYAAAEILQEKDIAASVINTRFIKPLDEATILPIINKTKNIITVEDNTFTGGVGNIIASLIQRNQLKGINQLMMSWPDEFIEHGSVKELDKKYGLTVEAIVNNALKVMDR